MIDLKSTDVPLFALKKNSGLYRTTSSPVLQNDPRVALPHQRSLQRGMSGMLGANKRNTGGWNRTTSPSVDLSNSPAAIRRKSGQYQPMARRNSVSLGQGEMVKLQNMGDTFEKAKQHVRLLLRMLLTL